MKVFIAFFMEKNLVVLAPNKLIILSLPSLSFSMSPKKFWGNSSKEILDNKLAIMYIQAVNMVNN